MKRLFIFLIAAVIVRLLLGCKSSKVVERATSEAETVVHGTDRLAQSLWIDSLSRSFSFSADSIIFVFATTSSLPTRHRSGRFAPAKNPEVVAGENSVASTLVLPVTPTANQLASVGVYGLQVGANTNQKSVAQASDDTHTQDAATATKIEESRSEKAAPSNAPNTILWLALLAVLLYIAYRFRRILFPWLR